VAYAELCGIDREPYLQSVCNPLLRINDRIAGKLLEHLSGRTLLFNGDSISVEHWMATACALLPGADTHSHLTVSSLAPVRSGASKAMRSRTLAMCVSLDRGGHDATRLCYSRLLGSALRSAAESLGPTGVIVANWGIQYHTPTGKVGRELANVTAETISALTGRPRSEQPHLIWREIAPQHFPSLGASTGNYGVEKSWWRTTRADCAPIQQRDTSYNDLVRPIVQAAGIPILPIWEPSVPHHEAHFSWKPLGARNVLDCTHYCLASGLLDHWVEILIAQLLESLNIREPMLIGSAGDHSAQTRQARAQNSERVG
jgi:hypothetical protein